jgi:zeaxanthin glucosyltransferase
MHTPELHNNSTRTRPVIVFLVSLFPSHVFSTTGLARNLRDLGFEVEYWGAASVRRTVLAQGFPHFELHSVCSSYERTLPAGWHGWIHEPGACAATLLRLRGRFDSLPDKLNQFESSLDLQLARRAPALVLLDPFAAAYYPFLRAREVRCVLLQDKPLPAADPLVPPPTSWRVPTGTRLSKAATRLQWTWERWRIAGRSAASGYLTSCGIYTQERLADAVLMRAREVPLRLRRRVKYDLSFDDLEEWIVGTPETDLPRLYPLPKHVRYIGNHVDLHRVQAQISLPAHSGRRVVYVSMGAMVAHWSLDLRLWEKVLAALNSFPDLAVYASTGNMRTRSALKATHRGAHIAAFLPQIKLLEIADLAITHAGANSFRECIATSTPMLAFPREYDQHGNSARILHHGIGLRGSRWRDTVSSIRRKIRTALEEPQYTTRVRELSRRAAQRESSMLRDALNNILPA